MNEYTGNLWDIAVTVRCITTNGTVKKNGEAVMGRGCALEAKRLFPGLALTLGRKILDGGNVPHILIAEDRSAIPDVPWNGQRFLLISFPVKHAWYEQADLNLIEQSAQKLLTLIPPKLTVALPRPGCGNGSLQWPDVLAVLEPIFGDNNPYIYIVKKRGEL